MQQKGINFWRSETFEGFHTLLSCQPDWFPSSIFHTFFLTFWDSCIWKEAKLAFFVWFSNTVFAVSVKSWIRTKNGPYPYILFVMWPKQKFRSMIQEVWTLKSKVASNFFFRPTKCFKAINFNFFWLGKEFKMKASKAKIFLRWHVLFSAFLSTL